MVETVADDSPPNPESHDGLVLLRSANTRAELQIAAAELAAEGIASIVKAEMDSSMYPVGSIHLFVDGDDLEAAREIIGDGVELEADFSYGPGIRPNRARRAGMVMGLVYFGPLALLVLGAIVVALVKFLG